MIFGFCTGNLVFVCCVNSYLVHLCPVIEAVLHRNISFIAHNVLLFCWTDWASRVYYSDNGSTAIEIALKMAFRKFMLDHGVLVDNDKSITNEINIQLKVCCSYTKHLVLIYKLK